MNPTAKLIILPTVIMGTTITMMSSHWLVMWAGLEINMLAFIPLLINKGSPRSTEAATKYFMTQATASMLLLMAIVINTLDSGQWSITHTQNYITSFMALMALTMKLGLAPFHLWVPEVTQGTTLMSGMLLLTWQKLAPISILYQLMPSINHQLLMLMALLSIMVGGWGGLNQTQLRKIMAYSSIAHMGWMMAIIPYSPMAFMLNLTIYILLTITMFTMINHNTNTSTLTLAHSWNVTPMITPMLLISLLSLGGLPPLTGFLPKWIIIDELTKNDLILMPTTMAMMALLNLYFYVRLIYSTTLTLFPTTSTTKMKWRHPNNKPSILLPPLFIITTMTLPLTPLMFTLS
uniref:NADH-ubiquinone oxidoreductase chain 2 n=1 Tax=Castor canadensis TaxID=51338 RepID=A0A343AZF4_CASCN|nr:NADH dehydrogenase subunit 2 [Castor canadensis]